MRSNFENQTQDTGFTKGEVQNNMHMLFWTTIIIINI